MQTEKRVTVVVITNPFNLDRQMHSVDFTACINAVGYVKPFLPCEEELVYSVNGKLVESPSETYLEPGDYLVVCPVVAKGGGGKNPLQLIAGIALSVVTMGVGGIASRLGWGAAMSSWTFSGYLAAAATMYLGGKLMSSMFSPAMPDLTDNTSSPSYGWDNGSINQTQGNPVPLVYGTVKITNPTVLSQHISSDGTNQYYNLLLCGGEGPANSITDIRINDNPVTNYEKVLVETRLGTNDQSCMSHFADTFSDQSVNYELDENWSTNLVDGNTGGGLEITLDCPNGLYVLNNEGNFTSASVSIAVEYRITTDASWSVWGSYTLSGSSNSAINKSFRIDNLPQGQYEVRVRVTSRSAEVNSTRASVRVYWTQLTSIIYDDFTRPNKVLVGLQALATSQLSGSLSSVTWLQTRSTVYVYNPNTGAYEEKPATNPAWACYDLIHLCRKLKNTNTGAYEYVSYGADKELFMWQRFKDWADYCDDKNLTVNVIIDSAADIWKALGNIEDCGRGKVIMAGTRFSCICDKPTIPVQMFTMGNIYMDSFKEEFLSLDDRANAIEVTFNNKAKNYERDSFTAYSDSYDTSDEVENPSQITLNGKTSFEEAYREAKYRLKLNQFLIRTCTFEADVDAIACQIGDVILLSHDVPQWGFSGRIESATSTTITLGREVDIKVGKSYGVYVRLKNDSIVYRAVKVVSDTTTKTVEVTSPFTEIPTADDIFTFGEMSKEAKPFRVVTISRSQDIRRKIVCLEYNENVYNEEYDIPVIQYSALPSPIFEVSKITLGQETYKQKDGAIMSLIYVSWQIPRERKADSFLVYYSLDNGAKWVFHSEVKNNTQMEIVGVKSLATYKVKVVTVNLLGQLSKGVVSSPIYITGKDTPPPNVTGLAASVNTTDRTKATIEWEKVIANDLRGYNISFNGTTYFTSANSYSMYSSVSNPTVSVVAVDDSGNTSVTPATIVVPIVPSPSNVTGLACVQKSTDRSILAITWSAVADTDISQYEVRIGDTWNSGVMIDRTKALGVSYQLTSSGYYKVFVAAINSAGIYSSNPTGTTINAVCEPNIPAGLAFVQDSHNSKNIILSWTPSSGLDIFGYEVYRNGVYIATSRSATYTDVVTISATYQYKIRAKTVGGFFSGYANLSATIVLEPLDVTGFTGKQLVTDNSIIRLTWDPNSKSGLSYYEIREGSSWDNGTVTEAHVVGTYADVVISEERTFTWWIKAVTTAGFKSLYPSKFQGIFNLNPSAVGSIQIAQSASDRTILNIQWSQVTDGDLKGYQVKVGESWDSAEPLPFTQELYTSYTINTTGSVKVMIKSMNTAGYYSDETETSGYFTVEPTNCTNFIGYQNGTSVELYWDKSVDIDVVSYEIREGATFSQGSIVASGVTLSEYMVPVDSEKDYHYHIKAISSSGNYSLSSLDSYVTVANLPIKNVIKTFDQISLQNGTKTNVEFGPSLINFSNLGGRFSDYPTTKFSDIGGRTVLKLANKNGVYVTSGEYLCQSIDIGSIITANITVNFVSTVVLKGSGSAILQIRTSQDGSTWIGWNTFKPVQYAFRYVQFKVLLGTTDTSKTPEVNQCLISIDVPDTDIAKTAVISKGGTTVNYGHTFYTVPVVTPTAIGDGLHAVLVSKTTTGCTIKIKNESNTDVGGTADIRIKGY